MLAASHSWHRLQPRQSLTFAASAVRKTGGVIVKGGSLRGL